MASSIETRMIFPLFYFATQILALANSTHPNGITLNFTVSYQPKPIRGGSSYKAHSESGIISTLVNQGSYYTTNLTVGSQQDNLAIFLDTGSSDFYVIADYAACALTFSGQLHDYCLQFGTFSVGQSTTIENLNQTFAITYGDGTGALGDLYQDQVAIDGIVVEGVTFAAATVTSSIPGLLGLGFESNEAALTTYVNFPAQLVKQGLILKNYYSLFLNGPNEQTGSIIFGGIDDTKYEGSLTKIPLQSNSQFLINLDSVTSDGFQVQGGYSVLLDSGTTYTILQPATVQAISTLFENAVFDPDIGLYRVDGAPANSSLTYHFSTAEIKVPLNSLFGKLKDNFGKTLPGNYLFIIPGGNTLGDNFLRWAYVVYDLDDLVVQIAPSKIT